MHMFIHWVNRLTVVVKDELNIRDGDKPTCMQILTTVGVHGNNVLFWGCSVNSPEGYRVSQALRESTYPFLAVIVLRQNRMMVVGR